MEDNKDVAITTEENETKTKTYSETDINNSFNAGMKKAHENLKKDKDYIEFQEWKKNHESDSEKLNNLQNDFNNVSNENALLKAQLKVNETNVKKEFAKFVTSEVRAMVNETTDFDTALKKYKEENPQFFGETVVKKTQTSPKLTGTSPTTTTTNDIMNELLRRR